nr:hypothetical protein [Tanacetum cinerariifolium]
MPPIPMSVHLVAVFKREALEEAHWGDFCHRNYLEISKRIRQRDVVIENIHFVGNRQIIHTTVALLRGIQLGDIGKLDWFKAMVVESNRRLHRVISEQNVRVFKLETIIQVLALKQNDKLGDYLVEEELRLCLEKEERMLSEQEKMKNFSLEEAKRMRLEEEKKLQIAEVNKRKRLEFMNSTHVENILGKFTPTTRNDVHSVTGKIKPKETVLAESYNLLKELQDYESEKSRELMKSISENQLKILKKSLSLLSFTVRCSSGEVVMVMVIAMKQFVVLNVIVVMIILFSFKKHKCKLLRK